MEPMLIKFEAYLLTEKRVSRNTFAAYQHDIRQFVYFLRTEHNTDITNASREQIKSFLHYLNAQGLAARSLSRKISSLKVLYTYLHTYQGLENRCDDLIFPKLEKRLPRYLREDEVETLFAIADRDLSPLGMRNKVMLYLLYVSGMRISELINLTVGQLQFESSLITVTGKGGKGRVIPIPRPVSALLKQYVDTGLKDFMTQGEKRRKCDILFPVNYAGKIKPISRQAFWAILKDLWEKTGIERSISPHQLRHSLATHMLKNGIDLRSLQLILGHENLATVQIYTHLETGYLRKVYDKKHPRS
jgi:site-specific recombinase XerD